MQRDEEVEVVGRSGHIQGLERTVMSQSVVRASDS